MKLQNKKAVNWRAVDIKLKSTLRRASTQRKIEVIRSIEATNNSKLIVVKMKDKPWTKRVKMTLQVLRRREKRNRIDTIR